MQMSYFLIPFFLVVVNKLHVISIHIASFSNFFSAITCDPKLVAPSNGYLKSACNNVYQSVCEFGCNDGYVLSGSSSRTCQASKVWSGTPAQCQSEYRQKTTNPAKLFILYLPEKKGVLKDASGMCA